MSHDLVGAALWLDMPPTRKLVLVALCERADLKTGKCWPGRKEVAMRASLTERNVSPHFKALEESGWIRSGPRSHTPGLTTRRWVSVGRILEEGEARRAKYIGARGDDSSPLDEEEGMMATGGGDADGIGGDASDRYEGMPQTYEPSLVTVIKEPSKEPSLDDPPLSKKEISLRKNYAESQRRVR